MKHTLPLLASLLLATLPVQAGVIVTNGQLFLNYGTTQIDPANPPASAVWQWSTDNQFSWQPLITVPATVTNLVFGGLKPTASTVYCLRGSYVMPNGVTGAWFTAATLCNAPQTVPVITAQPQTVAAVQGQAVSFSVAATGQSIVYQWYNAGNAIAGATNGILAVVAGTNGTSYSVSVANYGGTNYSDAATLVIVSVPSMTWGSLNQHP